MIKQSFITEKHRLKLIDWIIEIEEKFSFLEETLFLTINIIDRYLTKCENVELSKLQLVGVAAMFIAGKYQEIYPPELRDYIHLSGFTKEKILKMEEDILRTLNFELLIVSPLNFYNRLYFICAGNEKELDKVKYHKNYYHGLYLMQLSLLEYKMLKYPASVIASSACILSRKFNQITPSWPKQLMSEQGFHDFETVEECIKDIIKLLVNEKASNIKGLRKKFSKDSYFAVYNCVVTGKFFNVKN